MEYVDKGADYYESQYRDRDLINLRRRADAFGFTLQENVLKDIAREVS